MKIENLERWGLMQMKDHCLKVLKEFLLKKKHSPSPRYSSSKLVPWEMSRTAVPINSACCAYLKHKNKSSIEIYYILWALTETILKFRIYNKMADCRTVKVSVSKIDTYSLTARNFVLNAKFKNRHVQRPQNVINFNVLIYFYVSDKQRRRNLWQRDSTYSARDQLWATIEREWWVLFLIKILLIISNSGLLFASNHIFLAFQFHIEKKS